MHVTGSFMGIATRKRELQLIPTTYTRCAAGLVLDVGIDWTDQIYKNSSKICAAGPLESPYPFPRVY